MVKEGEHLPPASSYADFFNPLKEQELFPYLQQAIVFFHCWPPGKQFLLLANGHARERKGAQHESGRQNIRFIDDLVKGQ